MFIWRFFVGSWWGRVIGFFCLIILVPIIFVVVMSLLLITGGPGPCTAGDGAINGSPANAASFNTKWDALDAALGGASPASDNFNESEITSRAQEFVDATGAPFKNVKICIHDGFGEGTAELSVLGIGVKVKIKGNVVLSGASPQAHIDEIEAGNVPGFITSFVTRAVEDVLADIDLHRKYTLTLTEGNAKIDGQP